MNPFRSVCKNWELRGLFFALFLVLLIMRTCFLIMPLPLTSYLLKSHLWMVLILNPSNTVSSSKLINPCVFFKAHWPRSLLVIFLPTSRIYSLTPLPPNLASSVLILLAKDHLAVGLYSEKCDIWRVHHCMNTTG